MRRRVEILSVTGNSVFQRRRAQLFDFTSRPSLKCNRRIFANMPTVITPACPPVAKKPPG